MKLVVVSVAFLVGSYAVAAQSAASTQFRMPVTSDCPVSMRLDQAVNSGSHLVANGQRPPEVETSVHLVLSRSPHAKIFPSSIKAAQVTVHGFDNRPHQFEILSSSDAPITQNLHVDFTSAGDAEVYSDFVVTGLSSVGWLKIDSLTFAQGTIWKPTQGETCAVAPSIVRPVKHG